MGFTDNTDIFASFHEDGFNRIVGHVRSQRPSLFNYATAEVASNRELWCSREIPQHPIIELRQNPLFKIVDPLPIPGTNFGVNFVAQVVDMRIDFHPGDEFDLPPQLNPPLPAQRLAIKVTVCGGIGCPDPAILDQFIPPPEPPPKKGEDRPPKDGQEEKEIIPIPTRQMLCFCLNAVAVGGVRIATYHDLPYLEPYIDGFEIIDIEPTEIESNIECYIYMILRLSVLPGLRFLLKHGPLNLTKGATDVFPEPTNVIISPTPTSAALPNNPAIEEDQLKAFVHVEVV